MPRQSSSDGEVNHWAKLAARLEPDAARDIGSRWPTHCTAVTLCMLSLLSSAHAQESAAPSTTQEAPRPQDEASSTSAPEPAAPIAPIEVTVRAASSDASNRRLSADAVTVVETKQAQKLTADTGEVLARVQGITVQRTGGLGSSARLSLNGLADDQIRVYVDDLPLELAGYPFGIANAPLQGIDHIEVYRGVVPIRLGADALGGAVNIVTRRLDATRASASYQVGSFGTHRATLDGTYLHDPSGFVLSASTFFDTTDNDYEVNVDIPDGTGALSRRSVRRFHDGYRAYGASMETGVVDRSWANKLLVRGYVTGFAKELQHHPLSMIPPYGDARYGARSEGATLRYESTRGRFLELDLVASYAHRQLSFEDDSPWIYDWYGGRIGMRMQGGELGSGPTDQRQWQHTGYARANAALQLAPDHVLRANVTPTRARRNGGDRAIDDPERRDPAAAARTMWTLVTGLAYELSAWRIGARSEGASAEQRNRFLNVLFAKSYFFQAQSDEPLGAGRSRARARTTHAFGAGDSLRLTLRNGLYAKASYEYATRLPRPDEVFGDGALIIANLGLGPEVSHNGNLGLRYESGRSRFGSLTGELNTFVRESRRMIVLQGSERPLLYDNVQQARSLGLEADLVWTSPHRWLTLQATPTWLDQRNTSRRGTYARHEGDRLPNRPYLFASWAARGRYAGLFHDDDTVEPYYEGRYVHEFYRTWESWGLSASKHTVDTQLTHDLGLLYALRLSSSRITCALEISNLTAARVYDFFGIQRPGRAFALKLTGDF